MDTKKKFELENLPRVLPADKLCELFSINPQTFRVLMHRCHKQGVPLPKRKRVLRRYYYSVDDFALWLWTYGEALRGEFELKSNGSEGE